MEPLDAVALLFGLLVVWSFYQMHKDPNNQFNLLDLIMENGRVTRLGFAYMVLLVVSSWVIIKLMQTGKMTEGYYGLYGTMWVAPIIAKMFGTPPPAGKVTDITSHTEETK